MILLAIDTATRYASVALYEDDGVLAECSWLSQNNHSVEMMPEIDRLLARQGISPSELGCVAVTKGPGSFTGLRIGMSIAKGLCLALGIPIVAVPTLDVVAYAAGDPGMRVVAILEAGRGRLCAAAYRFVDGLAEAEGEFAVHHAADWVLDASEPVLVTGEVDAVLADRLMAQPDADGIVLPSLASSIRRAGYLAELAWNRAQRQDYDALDTLQPIYVHDSH